METSVLAYRITTSKDNVLDLMHRIEALMDEWPGLVSWEQFDPADGDVLARSHNE